jgi:hypothetical protein
LEDLTFYPRIKDEGVVAKSEPLVMLPVDVVFLKLDVLVYDLVVKFCVGDEVVFLVDRICDASKNQKNQKPKNQKTKKPKNQKTKKPKNQKLCKIKKENETHN